MTSQVGSQRMIIHIYLTKLRQPDNKIKTKESITSQKLGSQDFWQIGKSQQR